MAYTSELSLKEIRRDLHAYPEAGWKEFRTTALIAEELEERGFTIHLGADAVETSERLGVPPEDEIQEAKRRIQDTGISEKYLDRIGDVTGIVAEKTYGSGTGPTVGIRVDIDALERVEASDNGASTSS